MLRTLLLGFLLSIAGPLSAQIRTIGGPSNSKTFGSAVTILLNGNYVVTDPSFDNGRHTDAGAVYLFNGKTHALISRLTGSNVGDGIGSHGVVALPGGNFVIVSPSWGGGQGAVTWGDGTTGVSGNVSPLNSLTGGAGRSEAGSGGITVLPNGNYVVRSPKWTDGNIFWLGAVTLCDGSTGLKGIISGTNSLIGSWVDHYVGWGGVRVLTNGNYVVLSPRWGSYAGAATWCSATIPATGIVSASNSLVGDPGAAVGDSGIVALPNGNYLVRSGNWNNGTTPRCGAVTWGNGTSGVSGLVSASNSLIGGSSWDRVGDAGITVLSNGNYVVNSPYWSGSSYELGAVTWGSGSSGVSGLISTSNSLTGTLPRSWVGLGGVTALTNGNYVVNSYLWSNGRRAEVGALTWGDGAAGIAGTVSATNSLVGDSTVSKVGLGGVTALTNGNYVVNSYNWQNDSVPNAGAVTWCDGRTGRTGPVNASNSLVGDSIAHQVGYGDVTALTNGNYVVCSPLWSAGDSTHEQYFGAVTWADGSVGLTGWVTAANSLTGRTAYAAVGSKATALRNGHYVVLTPRWSASYPVPGEVGAVTWCDGTRSTSAQVTGRNSLVGGSGGDYIGSSGIVPLTDGNYVVSSPFWNRGGIVRAGAATWCNGSRPTSDTVDGSNSLVGSSANDEVGFSFTQARIKPLLNGGYIISSSSWDNGAVENAGAMTWGLPGMAVTGNISAANSLIGEHQDDQVGVGSTQELASGDYIIGNFWWTDGTTPSAGAVTWAGPSGIQGTINTCNSIIGARINQSVAYDPLNHRLFVGKPFENKYVIYTPGTNALISATRTISQRLIGTARTHFVDSNCELLVTITPGGSRPVAGLVRASTFVQPTAPNVNGHTYLRRSYELTPGIDPNTATARLTLYYTQADFDDYNQNNGTGPDMPAGPSDAAGIAAIRFTQQHGSSATGLPGSFSGWTGSGASNVLIDPNDADIVWNAGENRWEVSFDINGFSGFFAHVGSEPLEIGHGGSPAAGLSLSPVPASGFVQLDCRDSRLWGTEAFVSDIQGRVVARVVVDARTRIDIGTWPGGIYTLKLANGAILRIVKN